MSLLSNYELYGDSYFMGRLAMGLVKTASDIMNEDESTTNHAERLVWANSVLAMTGPPIAEAQRVFNLIMLNVTIANAGKMATDNDLLYVISSSMAVIADYA